MAESGSEEGKTFRFPGRPGGGGGGGGKAKKPKYFTYHFRMAGENESKPDVVYNLRLEKRHPETGEVLNEYHLWGDTVEDLLCDCPGAMYHASKEGPHAHKHRVWAEEWIDQILGRGGNAETYYSTEDERWHNPEDDTEESEEGEGEEAES